MEIQNALALANSKAADFSYGFVVVVGFFFGSYFNFGILAGTHSLVIFSMKLEHVFICSYEKVTFVL